MAIKIGQSFERTGAFPVDKDMLLTKAQMLTVNENMMPEKYFTICQDDGKIYLYSKENTSSAETGKFRVFEGGGGSGTDDYEALINQPKINGVTLISDKSGEDLQLQDKMDAITEQEIDAIIFG